MKVLKNIFFCWQIVLMLRGICTFDSVISWNCVHKLLNKKEEMWSSFRLWKALQQIPWRYCTFMFFQFNHVATIGLWMCANRIRNLLRGTWEDLAAYLLCSFSGTPVFSTSMRNMHPYNLNISVMSSFVVFSSPFLDPRSVPLWRIMTLNTTDFWETEWQRRYSHSNQN